jgi:hypothetical protein
MTRETMEEIVKSLSSASKGGRGVIEFVYKDVGMYLISDVTHDRMRIIAPVSEYEKVTREQLDAAMKSNFHTSLDARYAASDGILYSAYIHPMSTLSEEQIKSALKQVANLALSFGNEYSSGTLSFGNSKPPEEQEPDNPPGNEQSPDSIQEGQIHI